MRGEHFLLELACIEGFRFAAGLAFNQRLGLGATLLSAPDEVANIFAVVGTQNKGQTTVPPFTPERWRSARIRS